MNFRLTKLFNHIHLRNYLFAPLEQKFLFRLQREIAQRNNLTQKALRKKVREKQNERVKTAKGRAIFSYSWPFHELLFSNGVEL